MITAYKKFQTTGTWLFIFGIVISAGLAVIGFITGNITLGVISAILAVMLMVVLIGSWSISKTIQKKIT